MARPLRLSFSGALYHITARGNEKKEIFRSKSDRSHFLALLQQVLGRYNWKCYAYCLMDNHYHFLVETVSPTISRGMRHINGVYAQWFNRKYQRSGHLFQGRFKAILVQKDAHLIELARYIVLNPVRAKICERPEDYPWSSYRQTLGLDRGLLAEPEFILEFFSEDRAVAARNYAEFVMSGLGDRAWERLKGGIYFGSNEFIENLIEGLVVSDEVPRTQRNPLRPPLNELLKEENGLLTAYRHYGYQLRELAETLDLHYSTISRRISRLERCSIPRPDP